MPMSRKKCEYCNIGDNVPEHIQVLLYTYSARYNTSILKCSTGTCGGLTATVQEGASDAVGMSGTGRIWLQTGHKRSCTEH